MGWIWTAQTYLRTQTVWICMSMAAHHYTWKGRLVVFRNPCFAVYKFQYLQSHCHVCLAYVDNKIALPSLWSCLVHVHRLEIMRWVIGQQAETILFECNWCPWSCVELFLTCCRITKSEFIWVWELTYFTLFKSRLCSVASLLTSRSEKGILKLTVICRLEISLCLSSTIFWSLSLMCCTDSTWDDSSVTYSDCGTDTEQPSSVTVSGQKVGWSCLNTVKRLKEWRVLTV